MLFFKKLKNILKKEGTSNVKINNLEEILIEADFGPNLAASISQKVKNSAKEVPIALKSAIEDIMIGYISEIPTEFPYKPSIIILVGVNGSGKTTTIAKLAHFYQNKGKKVDIVACDTFRVAATEQLVAWSNKVGCHVFQAEARQDPASVAYRALKSTNSDILLIDTAGRLQNNTNLMEELSKILRVLKKVSPDVPITTYITIDATVGQNAVDQVAEFNKVCNISGLILNKIDGGAKGGIILRIINELKIPIVAVGTGESIKDISAFSLDMFLQDLT